MWSFGFWRLLREQLDAEAYNALFDAELERLLPRLVDPVQRQNAEGMRGFNWTGYIAGAVRRSGVVSQEDVDEKVHDIVIRMLVQPGGLFRNFNERVHGPFPLRFKRSIHNAVRNFAEKARTYRRFIRQELPAAVTADDLVAQRAPEGDHETIEGFREMVRRHLGPQALTVLDARMQGQEMKDLPISPYNIKKLVQGIKDLARRYAVAVADPALLAQIERMMATEERTVARRQATLRQRAGVAG